jgi:transcriptional regulator with XRE-family HTH domain
MELRAWRIAQDMTLKDAAAIFGMPFSSLSELERGNANVSRETIVRIAAATGQAVTAADHQATWEKANIQSCRVLRAAGRDAMKAYRALAASKPAKEKPNGGTSQRKRRGEEAREG